MPKVISPGGSENGGLEGQLPAIIPLNKVSQSPEDIVEQIRRQKGQSQSFTSMIDERYRETVISRAADSFRQKGKGRTLEEFTEDFALCWLAQKRAFEEHTKKLGFQSTDHINKDSPSPLLALTASGSLVAASPPNADGMRDIAYGRLAERESSEVPPIQHGRINHGLSKGERGDFSTMNTSPLIGLAHDPSASKKLDLQESFSELSQSFESIGSYALEGIRVSIQEPKRR
jgi:hypothetical protein